MIKSLIEKLKVLCIYDVMCSYYPYLKLIVGFIIAYFILDATADKDIIMMVVCWFLLLSLTLLPNKCT